MNYCVLGKTGIKVSKVGFGGIPIQRLTQDEANTVISKALDMGINFIDTARGYNESEELIGVSIKGRRDKVYIATKSMVRTKEAMMADVSVSLKNLQTDYIDLYQLHNVASIEELQRVLSIDGAISALLELKEKGIVRHIGITSHKLEVIEKALEYDVFETIQYPYSVVERQIEELFKLAKQKGVGTIAMKPMAGGALTCGRTAIKYILENPDLDCAIPGMESIEEVLENCGACDGILLTEEEKAELLSEAAKLGETFCRRCGYCMPCPNGINIPFVFIMEGYYSRYDLKDWALSRMNVLPVKPDACTQCGLCETRCPYNLPIREMLSRAAKIFK